MLPDPQAESILQYGCQNVYGYLDAQIGFGSTNYYLTLMGCLFCAEKAVSILLRSAIGKGLYVMFIEFVARISRQEDRFLDGRFMSEDIERVQRDTDIDGLFVLCRERFRYGVRLVKDYTLVY
ncbi:hypothetical protein CEXT_440331 [Caerostris extrusa]|uniref:Uncharacterized protein n=1 Tax=Caerostris extrusa TaxID=172846 RepID=A0AAV4UJJ5_CAEEX|nr:hypothetical protein CEXT_440331 [Caerostris extrusa]